VVLASGDAIRVEQNAVVLPGESVVVLEAARGVGDPP